MMTHNSFNYIITVEGLEECARRDTKIGLSTQQTSYADN